MKRNRHISFGFLIALAVLLCFGTDAYSNPGAISFTIELSSGSNNVANNFCSDIDSCDDDQISHATESCSVAEYQFQMPIPGNLFLINKFFLSVWQPPKIS